MSSALRELADAPDSAFDHYNGAPPDTEVTSQAAEPATQTPEQKAEQEPRAEEPKRGETPGEQVKQPEKPEQKEPRQVSKYELAKQKHDREAKAWQKIEAQKAELKTQEERLQRERAEVQRIQQESESRKDPARNLLLNGVKPEQMEAEAKKYRDNFDEPNAVACEDIAKRMRELSEQDQHKNQFMSVRETALRRGFGTPEFDNYASGLRRGAADAPETQAFNEAWAHYEQGLIAMEEKSSDPVDREIAAQWKDTKSEFGQKLLGFFRNTGIGQALTNHAGGMLVAYDIVKNQFKLEKTIAENQKLKQEVEKLRGATSIGGGSPSHVVASNGDRNPFNNPLPAEGPERKRAIAERGAYLRKQMRD